MVAIEECGAANKVSQKAVMQPMNETGVRGGGGAKRTPTPLAPKEKIH